MSKKKSRVNEAGNYTKPSLRKRIFQRIKAGTKGAAAFAVLQPALPSLLPSPMVCPHYSWSCVDQ